MDSRFTIHRVGGQRQETNSPDYTSLGGSTTLAGHGNGGNCVSRVPQDPVRPNCPPRVHTKFEAKRARVPNAADTKLRSRVPGGSPFKSGRASFGPQLSSLRDTFVTDCDFDGALIAKEEKKKKGRKKWRECKK